MVDLVRCRHDGKVYVLKSTLKGAAVRERYRLNPLLEKRIFLQSLTCDRKAEQFLGTADANPDCAKAPTASSPDDFFHSTLPTPRLHAAFQSHDTAHLIMEFFPAGDLEALLASAGTANSAYPGKSHVPGALLTEDWVISYAKDICAAVAWLHAIGFAHR